MISPAGKNLLSADIEIKGTITFKSDLVSHGKIEGEIFSSGTFTVGPSGVIDGDIQAASVAIHGKVTGNIMVEDRCELKGNARLIGDLEAPRLIMEEGATFIGRSNVVPRDTDAAQKAKLLQK
ncbi:MAG: polymer-forming cytoskeletal protein [Verrucomicrobiaceae bacterium]|nr:MAG: polymer-forming cytoskeletal protein [Verrucomicrobiaceae bacterium]